ncbi:polysaccharide pyruvyl transferase family protein [Oceaniovalibus sp. ACAM 378]|uniref:polysaccharide pyruvyl transferase family protein n=1 Tax=Oceaniovalibus sp. ACAM 378 TaxID=2599923 RepID=UPI001652A6E6|nr:polysaccharide pyruvyl transferase family protein [Oceaniovalibus sp. ACAM 378]
MNEHVRRLKRVASDLLVIASKQGRLPTVYFNDRPNVGDLLNEYLIPKIAGREIVKVRTSAFNHLRAIGSLVGSASNRSFIWGSGSIDGQLPSRLTSARRVSAVRGLKTRRVIEDATGVSLDDRPMGDPALLMPLYFDPVPIKEVKYGIIPHFSDEKAVRKWLSEAKLKEVRLISVQQDPESFVRQMLTCERVLSSSLHGLILADAYGIPNRWIKVSDELIGGDFKFLDYYSTVKNQDKKPIYFKSASSFSDIARAMDETRIRSFKYSLSKLLSAFPAEAKSAAGSTSGKPLL